MTRKDGFQAILQSRLAHGLLSDSLAADHKTADLILDALEALGLLKFEEPILHTQAHCVPILSWMETHGNKSALISEKTLVDTVRMIGYRVSKI